ADPAEAERVKKCTALPVIIGSGITADNLHRFWIAADAFIVGSSLKAEGKWYNPVEESRVRAFVGEVTKLRNPG
ncbi:MAG TPA: BtpA/SgcQ family protein, partial [Prolixibacteraceae bacterium]|nr:BtpA/SgcQ family protein [Prolixibacteraceae bacterium]